MVEESGARSIQGCRNFVGSFECINSIVSIEASLWLKNQQLGNFPNAAAAWSSWNEHNKSQESGNAPGWFLDMFVQ